MGEDDDFLSRWSRRKRAVAEEPEDQPVEAVESVPAPEPDVEDEEALLERLGLPAPETMKEGDDFSGFMARGVPEFLRKRALRVLWRSNPVLANLDGLNDYDDDFRSPELTQKVLATGYQVGRGFVKKVLEGDDADAAPAPEAPQAPEPEVALTTDEPLVSQAKIDADAPTEEIDAEDAEAPKPRRMRFVT